VQLWRDNELGEVMNGEWEKYVEPAADAITYHPGNRTGTPDSRHPVSQILARAVLAAVGPLIAEDTRERMVAAAGRALEKDASHQPDGLYYCATSDEIEQYPGGGFDVCCELGPAGHEPISEIAFRAVRKQVAEVMEAYARSAYEGMAEPETPYYQGFTSAAKHMAVKAREIATRETP